MTEHQEWVRVNRAAKTGEIVVAVTVMRGKYVARWSHKTHRQGITKATNEARHYALLALADLEAAA